MDIRQRIINMAARLRKQFPEENGRYAVVVINPQTPSFDEGFTGDMHEDNRPDFVKKDSVGWDYIATLNDD